MKEIKEIEINGEKVYLQKGIFGKYKTIQPIKKDLSKPFSFRNIHWKNFIAGGDYRNLIIIAIIVFILIMAISEYSNAVKIANKCLENCPWGR